MNCFSSKVNWKTVRITFRINLHSQLMFEYDFSATPKSDNASRATVSTISMRLFRLDPFDWINSQWTRVHHAQCIWLVTFFLIVSYFWWATQHIYTHTHTICSAFYSRWMISPMQTVIVAETNVLELVLSIRLCLGMCDVRRCAVWLPIQMIIMFIILIVPRMRYLCW